MDRAAASLIAHSGMALMNPLAETQLDEAIGLLGLSSEARVLRWPAARPRF